MKRNIYLLALPFLLSSCGGSESYQSEISPPKVTITQEDINNGKFNGGWFGRTLSSYGHVNYPVPLQADDRSKVNTTQLNDDLSERDDWGGDISENSGNTVKIYPILILALLIL